MQTLSSTKVCRSCSRQLPYSEFHAHKATRDRLRHECKACRAQEARDRLAIYRSANPVAPKMDTCVVCKTPFHRISHKQNVCSVNCRFDFYRNAGQPSNCWLWSGPKNSLGYGVLFLMTNNAEGRRLVTSAHRFAYQKDNGSIPVGMCVMHICDTPNCTNPAHLRIGTWAENNADRSQKGRSGSRAYTAEEVKKYSERHRGEGSNSAKLTEADVRAIREDPTSASQLCKKYGVSKSAILNIRRRRSWAHVI